MSILTHARFPSSYGVYSLGQALLPPMPWFCAECTAPRKACSAVPSWQPFLDVHGAIHAWRKAPALQ